MGFFNRFILLYATIVLALTAGYYYASAHFFVDGKGNASIWWGIGYIALIFFSALIISTKDDRSGYAGFNYHYIIVSAVMGSLIAFESAGAEKHENLRSLGFMMAFWGVSAGQKCGEFNSYNVKSYLAPVMAMVGPQHKAKNYLAAMTGDYDLWAVFPRKTDYGAVGRKNGKTVNIDERLVPGSDSIVRTKAAHDEHEDKNKGNITLRVLKIVHLLNYKIGRLRKMLHHGDEAGRPNVDAVELNYIAFIPGQREARFIATMDDMKHFLGEVMLEYYVTLNPGWRKQFGLDYLLRQKVREL